MVAIADLQPASYRGARFLVPRDSVQEGRHTIRHEYPDSSVVYLEDNGYCPPEFNVTAILHGANLLAQYNTLRSALNRPGPATLRHPWYGAQFVAVVGPWKANREDADSGVITFDIKFAVTGPAVFPAVASSIAAQVTSLSSAFVQAAFDTFAATYGNPILSVPSLETVSAAITDVASVFSVELGGVVGVGIASGHLLDTPERYVEDGTALGAQLHTLLRGPFEDLTNAYSGGEITSALVKVDAATSRAIVAADLTPNIGNATATLDYVARASALYTFSTFVRLTTVSCMAESMSGTIFKTADDVAASEDLLLSLYTSIPTVGVPVATARALADIVGAAMGVLRAEELQLPRIETLQVFEYPSSVLAYMLYEDDFRTQTLVELNLDQNPVLFDRQASVLTGVELPQ